jgi:hypothetical protein
MWTHLLEAVLNGLCLFVGPLMLVAAMGGGLTLIDRLAHFFGNRYRCRLVESRSRHQVI